MSHRRFAFTLIELLAVIGIIGVLIGLLLPTLAGARRASHQAACASNLRQWAIAVNEYAVENHQCIPYRGQGQQAILSAAQVDYLQDWMNALPAMLHLTPYMDLVSAGNVPRIGSNSIWICPEAPDDHSQFFFTYGMNMWLSPRVQPLPDRMDRVGPCSTMVFMADGPGPYCSVVPYAKSAPFNPSVRHSGRVNVAFLDGHVAALLGTELGCGTGDPLHDDIRWKVPNSPWTGPTY